MPNRQLDEEAIFHIARKLDNATDREKYLDQICSGDQRLRERVEGLLKVHEQEQEFLKSAPLTVVTTDRSTLTESPGQTIGRYKLLQQIGEGGFGVVYMAEQQRPIRRKVALKIIKPGMDTREVIARFEGERQALALMDHPNIARVLDGGTTDSGRPYFVMELVKGVPLTEYCDQNQLATNARLQLFIDVCHAVQHAHQKGIIHRDLKPSNILVTLHDGQPVVKVIDFGVAKAINQQLTEKTLFTSYGQMVGTPAYMSPEQAEMSGLDVDTRTDVYSLGVLLYELLTGTTPIDRKRLCKVALDEMRRIIREEEPPKPSTRISTLGNASVMLSTQRSTDPVRLKQLLQRELDWIVMKTLEKNRTRRYETVSALRAEIQRYLSGLPVEACSPSATYRLRKFVYRYRTSVSIVAAFLLLIVGSSIGSWILLAKAQAARDSALAAQASIQKERDRALEAERTAASHLLTAKREKMRADNHAQELKQKLYDYNITKAYSASRDDQLATAASLLAECLPEQRGWEWAFIHRLTKAAHSINLPTSSTQCFVITHDGKIIITADQSGIVRSVGMLDGRVQWTRKSDVAIPTQCILSPTGDRLLLVGSGAPTTPATVESLTAVIQLLRLRDGKPLWTERPAASGVYEPAFSPDGTSLLVSATKYADKTTSIQLRSSRTGQLAWSLPAGAIAQAVFDKTAEHIFISETNAVNLDGSSTIRCVSAADRKELWNTVRAKEVSGVILGPAGTDLITTGEDLSLVLLDTTTGAQKARYNSPLHEPGFLVRGSAAQGLILTVSRSGHCVMWDWLSKQPIDESRIACDPATLQLTSDGEQIAFMNGPGSTLQIRPTLSWPGEMKLLGHGSGFKGARFLDDARLCSVGNERALRIWETPTGRELKATSLDAGCLELDVARNGKWIAIASTKGTKLWDKAAETFLQDWPHDGQTWFAKFDASAATLATAGQQGILRVYKAAEVASGDDGAFWSTPVARPVHEWKASASIHGLAMSSDGATIYTLASPGCEVLAWDSATGERRVLRAPQAGQTGRTAELSPDGRLLALGIDVNVEIWDVQSGKLVARLKGPERKILSLTFDRTGSRLFAGSTDGVITLWNVMSQEVLLRIPAHTSYVVCLAMSPDNSTLASTSFGGEVKLWESRTLSSAVARQRRDVQHATEHANRLLIRYRHPREALEAVASDASISTPIKPTVIAILEARQDAPVNLQAIVNNTGGALEKSSDADFQLRRAASSLKARIDAAIGEDLAALQSPSLEAPNYVAAARWTALSRSLLQRSRSNSELNRIIPLLAHLTESDDAPHYLVQLKGTAHVDQAEWETAEVELSRAISLVPPQSPLWFEYAFRLAFLRAYLGKWDAYNELCKEAVDSFRESSEPVILERTAKMCLFSNRSTIDIEDACQLADRASGLAIGGNSVYAQLTRGIADLRRKNYDRAVETFNAVVKSGVPSSKEGNDILVALAKMYAAIACHHLGRDPEAEQLFAESAPAIRDFAPGTGWWPDWMMAELAMKEAEDLMGRGGE